MRVPAGRSWGPHPVPRVGPLSQTEERTKLSPGAAGRAGADRAPRCLVPQAGHDDG